MKRLIMFIGLWFLSGCASTPKITPDVISHCFFKLYPIVIEKEVIEELIKVYKYLEGEGHDLTSFMSDFSPIIIAENGQAVHLGEAVTIRLPEWEIVENEEGINPFPTKGYLITDEDIPELRRCMIEAHAATFRVGG